MTHSKDSNLGEQALNKAVEVGLSSQFEEVDQLEIDVETETSKLVQGEVDAVSLHGKGVVTPQNLRLEEIFLETDSIAINLIKMAFGEIQLKEPTNASIKAVLTEDDINLALRSDYVREQLTDFPVLVGEDMIFLNWKKGTCRLPGNDEMVVNADIIARFEDHTRDVSLCNVVRLTDGGKGVYLEEGKYLEGKSLPFAITISLFRKLNEILSLRKFQMQGIKIEVEKIEIQKGAILLWVKAHTKSMKIA